MLKICINHMTMMFALYKYQIIIRFFENLILVSKVRQRVPVGRVSCIHTLFIIYWVKTLNAYKLFIGYPIVLKNHFNPVTSCEVIF